MLSLLNNLGEGPPPAVRAAPERCLRRRLNTCDCRLCQGVCPTGALSFDGRQLQLDSKKCTGCMVCASVCPNEALVGSWDLEAMLRQVREQARQRLVISCIRRKRRSVEEIAVPCLGILGVETLVALGMSDCRSIEFDLAGCAVCENREAASRFLAICRQVEELAPQVLSARLSVLENTPEKPLRDVTDRRSFLAEIRANLTTLTRLSPDMPEFFRAPRPEATTCRRLPIRVKILDKAVADAVGEKKEQLLALCTHRLSTGPACDCCPLCTGICPTGALRVAGSGKDKQLVFNGIHCSGCGLCVSFCRKEALTLSLPPLAAINPPGR